MKLHRIAASLVLATGLATAPGLTSAAHAGPSCQTYFKTYNYQGERAARICTGNGGDTWSLRAYGDLRGVDKFMKIRVCRVDAGGGVSQCDNDQGRFKLYAGPVDSPGGCLKFFVKMSDGKGGSVMNDRPVLCN